MALIKLLGRSMAALAVLALVACQTPLDSAQVETEAPATDAAVAPAPAPQEPIAEPHEAVEQAEDFSPLMVFLADFEPVSDWVEVGLDDETTLYLQPTPSFTRDDLMSVETYSSESGDGLLALILTDPAAQRLEALTSQNPGRRLALAVEGTLLAVPRYSEPLTNGQLVFMVGSVDNAQTAARMIAGDDGRAVPYSAE